MNWRKGTRCWCPGWECCLSQAMRQKKKGGKKCEGREPWVWEKLKSVNTSLCVLLAVPLSFVRWLCFSSWRSERQFRSTLAQRSLKDAQEIPIRIKHTMPRPLPPPSPCALATLIIKLKLNSEPICEFEKFYIHLRNSIYIPGLAGLYRGGGVGDIVSKYSRDIVGAERANGVTTNKSP